jgi:L-gulonolactone oxidase
MARQPYISNWAGNQRFQPTAIAQPSSEDELGAVIARATQNDQQLRVMGAGHSFTAAAVTGGTHVTMHGLDQVHHVDTASGHVTVGAGITVHALNRELDRHGLALANMGDIDKQSIAGAISTSTHGTGLAFTGFGAQVVGLRLVDADGESRDIDSNNEPELFANARVSLGALGVISRVTLRTVPSFRIHAVEQPEPLDEVLDNWRERIDTADHFEFFMLPGSREAMTKTNRRTEDEPAPLSRFAYTRDKLLLENVGFGLLCRVARRWPRSVPKVSKIIDTGGGRREYTDRSFDVFTTPRMVKFYETEWSLPVDAIPEAVREVNAMARSLAAPIIFPIEVRATAGDDVPLSTAHGRESGYIAAHVYQGTSHDEYFANIAAIAQAHGGRPHWGKLHNETADSLAGLYPEWDRFQAARAAADPQGRFSNTYVDRVLGPVLV